MIISIRKTGVAVLTPVFHLHDYTRERDIFKYLSSFRCLLPECVRLNSDDVYSEGCIESTTCKYKVFLKSLLLIIQPKESRILFVYFGIVIM